MKKLIPFIALILAASMLFAACSNGTTTTSSETTAPETQVTTEEKTTLKVVDNGDGTTDIVAVGTMPVTEGNYSTEHKRIRFTLENGGTFVIETYPEFAPETCDNFVNLVSEGFYDGLTFHRIADLTGMGGYIIQGGDPKGNGTGGSDKKIHGEFAENGFAQNTMAHERGVVSMARSNHPDSASSQFFICCGEVPHLDGAYAAFGKIVEGMDTVDSLLEVDMRGTTPAKPIVIEKAEII